MPKLSRRRRWPVTTALAMALAAGSLTGSAEGAAGRSLSAGSRAGGASAARPGGVRLAADVRPAASQAPIPAACVPPSGEPPYVFGFVATVTGGSLSAGPVSATPIDVDTCGLITVSAPSGGCPFTATLDAPPAGQNFDSLAGQPYPSIAATLALVPGQPVVVPFHLVRHDITGILGCASSVGGLAVTASVTLDGSAGVFGVSCEVGPVVSQVHGIFKSSQPGNLFASLTGTLAGSFTLPEASISQTCPIGAASSLDQLAGLPHLAQLTLPTVAGIYLP